MCDQCHKLEAAWTGVPTTLARNKRLFNIVSNNKELLEKLSTMAQRDIDQVVRTWQRDPELMMQVLQTLTGKPLLTADKNTEILNKFKDNIGQAYRIGLDAAPGSPQLIPRMIEESVKDNVFKFVTRLDDDTRSELGSKLSEIIQHNRTAEQSEKLMPRDVAIELSKTLDGNVARAEAIARTETMRAANLASWSQAKAMDATHYTVDSSFEACEECSETYDGQVFPIDDIDNLPPLHPNCACVPAFGGEEDMQGIADELSQRNEDEVQNLADKGMEPAPDGSGPVEINEVEDKEENMAYEYSTVDREEIEDYVNEIIDKYDKEVEDDVFVRGANFENFDEQRFLNSQSYDEFVVEEPRTESEAQDLIDQYDIPGEPYQLPESQRLTDEGWGVKYEGVNALQEYDDNLMGHTNHIVVFSGEEQGENLLKDGDIISPNKVLEVIKVQK